MKLQANNAKPWIVDFTLALPLEHVNVFAELTLSEDKKHFRWEALHIDIGKIGVKFNGVGVPKFVDWAVGNVIKSVIKKKKCQLIRQFEAAMISNSNLNPSDVWSI